jgi:multidrug efflux pump subunit AcrA (membrane-fusion protein)
VIVLVAVIPLVASLSSCSGRRTDHVQANGPAITVGVTKVAKKSLGRQITLSAELVPFQEIDVYAKESGYVKKLLVDLMPGRAKRRYERRLSRKGCATFEPASRAMCVPVG